jgi:hypothetical protein
MDELIGNRSWKDPGYTSQPNDLSGIVVFKALSTLYLECVQLLLKETCHSRSSRYFHRFKDSLTNHPHLMDIVTDLEEWFANWSSAVSAAVPTFEDPITEKDRNSRQLIVGHVRGEIERLMDIVSRESGRTRQRRRDNSHATGSKITAAQKRQAAIMQLAQAYDPPGELREDGPRHDNDFEDISSVRVAPTHEELLCESGYLPVFSPNAPHHLRENSMERHLDIQFRLLREELMYVPICLYISSTDGLFFRTVHPSGPQSPPYITTYSLCQKQIEIQAPGPRKQRRPWRVYSSPAAAHTSPVDSTLSSFMSIPMSASPL